MTDTRVPALVLKLYGQGSLGAVRTLGRLGVEVHGVHDDPGAPAAGSRYCRGLLRWNLDNEPAERSAEALVEYARRFDERPLLVATDDVGALFLDDEREALRGSFRFADQPPGLPRRLYSKQGMYELCREHDVPTPDTEFPRTRSDVEDYAGRGPFPVVLKPIDAWRLLRTGGQMLIARGPDELLDGYDRMEEPAEPNFMLQEYVPGGPESVWMFNGAFDERSDCLVSFTGRKLRQRPPYTGMTSLGVCVRNDEVERLTKDFLKRVGYRGVVDIGWRYDERDGRYKLLDVNPRLGNTFRLFVGTNGIDVLRAHYLEQTGQPVPPTEWREGRKWLVENFDLQSSATYLRDGGLTVRDWARSFRGVEEAAWWARDDPRPFARMAGRLAGSAARRIRR